jgi:hypothetical protein
MRTRTILLAAAVIGAPLHAQPAEADARAVVAAVLAQEAAARGPEAGAETCVARELAGPPAPGGEDDPMVPNGAVRIGFQWHAPPPPAPVRPPRPPEIAGRRSRVPRAVPIPPPPPLDQASAARLTALRVQAHAAPLSRVDPALVPPPFQLQGANDDCFVLTLSAPAFAGDAAFVEIAYACGTVCGNGNVYAVERRAGRWEVTGVADIWIR